MYEEAKFDNSQKWCDIEYRNIGQLFDISTFVFLFKMK